MDVRGECLNDGLSVVTVGSGPALVSIPGLGQGVDLSLGVPRPDLLSARAIATSTGRTVHVIARPLDPPPGMTISDLAGFYATAIERRFGGAVDIFGGSAGGVTALQLAIARGPMRALRPGTSPSGSGRSPLPRSCSGARATHCSPQS